MRSHFMVGRGLAAACVAALPSGECQAQVAFDSPGQPAYDNGWQQGDNGGFGFGPWSMFGTYNTPVQHVLDSTTIHNNVKVTPVNPGTARSWALYNADAPPGPGSGTDISQAGRGLLNPLQVGQTISVIIDNPTERRFFRGYTVRFNTGGNNTTSGGTAQARLSVGTFEYFTNGQWYVAGSSSTSSTLFDVNTNGGMRIDMKLNTVNTYSLTMTPLLNPGMAFSTSGTLAGPVGSSINWIEFELFNTDSDWYPSPSGGGETDFYIGGMQVIPAPQTCYPNCDNSTAAPILNVNDFTCFLNKFAASDPYANCDGSTTPPTLNVNDFTCFLNKYAAGCP